MASVAGTTVSEKELSLTCTLTPAELATIEVLRTVGAEYHRRGWSLGTSSNYSVVAQREPLELLLTVSGKDKGRLQREDFVRVGADGRPVEPDAPRSSAETMLHVALAELPEVGAVLHTHSVWGTLLSERHASAGGFELNDYEMLKGLEGITTHATSKWVDVFANTQDIPTLANELRSRLRDPQRPLTHGFLIRKHGLYAWGRNLDDARRHIEIFEFLFECEGRLLGWS